MLYIFRHQYLIIKKNILKRYLKMISLSLFRGGRGWDYLKMISLSLFRGGRGWDFKIL